MMSIKRAKVKILRIAITPEKRVIPRTKKTQTRIVRTPKRRRKTRHTDRQFPSLKPLRLQQQVRISHDL
jgi:hypothetical protein